MKQNLETNELRTVIKYVGILKLIKETEIRLNESYIDKTTTDCPSVIENDKSTFTKSKLLKFKP